MKVSKIGVLIKKDHVVDNDIRRFIDVVILRNDDNLLNIGKGFRIDNVTAIGEIQTEQLVTLCALSDTWGYVDDYPIEDIEAKQKGVEMLIEMDDMRDDDYFVKITVYEEEIEDDEIKITIGDNEAYITYITDDLNKNNIKERLTKKFNLDDDVEIKLSNLKVGDVYDDNRFVVTNKIDKEFAKYLVTLLWLEA